MTSFRNTLGIVLVWLLVFVTGIEAHAVTTNSPSISYNRDIRPILSQNCFYCHGPDAGKRKGKMRLDIREEAIKKEAFVPGNPLKSELVKRINSKDPEELMPPPASAKTLNAVQKEQLRRWIAGGAKYEGHWAYDKPIKPGIPSKSDPVDYLVRKRLQEVKLSPSKEADSLTLVRRLYFDLIGIPPKPEEADAYIHDKSPDRYPHLVEKLLASPHYGERMALGWLDVVRFADTIGYHSDNPRNVWPYRDYVIRSFNQDKPFDVFTKEQLAGDLLPESGPEQKVGSAFNRLLLTTEEGGAQAKDYEARMLTDRVRAVGAIWMGQTIGCAQCHDHKFDPITSRDFYSMGAFFADIKETIVGRREDGMMLPDEKQAMQLAKLQEAVKKTKGELDGPHPELKDAFDKWNEEQSQNAWLESQWQQISPVQAESSVGNKLNIRGDHTILVQGTNSATTEIYSLWLTNLPNSIVGLRLEALPEDGLPHHGPGRGEDGNFILSKVIATVESSNKSPEDVKIISVRASFNQSLAQSGVSNSLSVLVNDNESKDGNGWSILSEVGKRQELFLGTAQALNLSTNDSLKLQLVQNHADRRNTLGHFRISVTTNAGVLQEKFSYPALPEIASTLAVAIEKRDQSQKDKVWSEFKKLAPELESKRASLVQARKELAEFEAGVPRCLVSVADENPRTVRILPRGNFLNETGEIVQPAFPGYLKASWQKMDKPKLTRLDLANWLVSRDNPLTARVIMNRMWKQFFGVGLAKPLDDFGAQGDAPRNQELLDWLACEFMDSGWDMKHMVRLIVSSHTYQQTSVPSARAREIDPFNREFSAQGRWRLDAELVRDNALAISGLLVDKVGGPSVKPYQPAGYWENLNFPTREWEQGNGGDLYRRGLYTWWQRSYLQPSLLAFDAPSREECCAERNRSNIPQQALALLNDPSYVESSRVLAGRVIKEGGAKTEDRLRWIWLQALDRPPRKDELATAKELLNKHSAEYRNDTKAAEALIHVGAAPLPEKYDPAELAAWTSVSRLVLNLHETITRN